MSEEEFLARWSRRKREATLDVPPPEAAASSEAQQAPSAPAAEQREPEVDLSSLPSIDSITAATDITAFLRQGIPQELTRAALRRAWAADPAIRDFVGLAENAWDFNDPNAMPGFGPLDCSQAELSALLERIVGGVRKAAEALSGPSAAEDFADSADDLKPAEALGVASAAETSAGIGSPPDSAALQPVAEKPESNVGSVRRRTHGGALPR